MLLLADILGVRIDLRRLVLAMIVLLLYVGWSSILKLE